jgi:hypothetical protein
MRDKSLTALSFGR